MILESKGIRLAENVIAEALETTIRGANVTDVGKAVSKLKITNIKVTVFQKTSFDDFALLIGQRSSVVSLDIPGKGLHAVIIDKIADGKVFIRDPLPIGQGSAYTIDIRDLRQLFNERGVIID